MTAPPGWTKEAWAAFEAHLGRHTYTDETGEEVVDVEGLNAEAQRNAEVIAARERQAYAEAKGKARALVAEAEAEVAKATANLSAANAALVQAKADLLQLRQERCFKRPPAVGTRVRWTRHHEPVGVVIEGGARDKDRVPVQWDDGSFYTARANVGEPLWDELEPE